MRGRPSSYSLSFLSPVKLPSESVAGWFCLLFSSIHTSCRRRASQSVALVSFRQFFICRLNVRKIGRRRAFRFRHTSTVDQQRESVLIPSALSALLTSNSYLSVHRRRSTPNRPFEQTADNQSHAAQVHHYLLIPRSKVWRRDSPARSLPSDSVPVFSCYRVFPETSLKPSRPLELSPVYQSTSLLFRPASPPDNRIRIKWPAYDNTAR